MIAFFKGFQPYAIYMKDVANLEQQWDNFKDWVLAKGFLGQDDDKDRLLLAEILLESSNVANTFIDIMFLIEVKLLLFLETADCERGFSLRTLIKTKQRCSMGNTLLDVLMMISSNGPDLDDRDAVCKMIGRALLAFKDACKRFPSRSSANVPRTKRGGEKVSPLAQLRNWAEAVRNDGLDDEESVQDRQQGSEAVGAETEEQGQRNEEQDVIARVGPFPANTDEWSVVEKLDEMYKCPGKPQLCKETEKLLKNKDIAFLVESGWEIGRVHMAEKSKARKGLFSVKIKGVKGWLCADLRRDNYGRDKVWVLLEKPGAAEAAEQ